MKGRGRSASPGCLAAVAAGDPAALEECLERFGGLVWSLARGFLANNADAEEAVQDVFAELWAHADRFDPERASEATFVTMIARRRLIDRGRREGRRGRTEPLTEANEVAAEPGGDHVESRDELARVAETLERLRPIEREAIRLSVYHGLSHQQVAETLGKPLGTVKSHIRRGLLRVRELVGTGCPPGEGGRI